MIYLVLVAWTAILMIESNQMGHLSVAEHFSDENLKDVRLIYYMEDKDLSRV